MAGEPFDEGVFEYRAVETAMTDKHNPIERGRLPHQLIDLPGIIRPVPDIPQLRNVRIEPVPVKGFQSTGGLLRPPWALRRMRIPAQ